MDATELAALRKSYERDALDEATASDSNPLKQFDTWFEQARAAQVPEPNAMTLATVGPDGRPSTRVVLIKAFDARGLVWYTNYGSRKGRELAHSAFAALQFHWVELERVVRIEGTVSKVDDADSEAYFHSRPLASRISALVSPQSEVVPSRAALAQWTAEAAARHGEHPPRPAHWGGYRLAPDRWEFWQGRRDRLHDRLRYRLDGGAWVRERLAP
jgi:pyridoxamine 5'-phosphate oxidase